MKIESVVEVPNGKIIKFDNGVEITRRDNNISCNHDLGIDWVPTLCRVIHEATDSKCNKILWDDGSIVSEVIIKDHEAISWDSASRYPPTQRDLHNDPDARDYYLDNEMEYDEVPEVLLFGITEVVK